MNSELLILAPLYLGTFIIFTKIIKRILKKQTVPFNYGFVLLLLLVVTTFFTNHQLKNYSFQNNLDAVFAYFQDCDASVNFEPNSKSTTPFHVSACGDEYLVFVEKGAILKVELK